MCRLINELSKLPSIGEKTATRLAYSLITKPKEHSRALAEAIYRACDEIRLCDICFAFTEKSPCGICSDPRRVRETVCVVEKPADVMAIERSSRYKGLYHVLHGLWSPLRGIAPEQTKIHQLVLRLKNPPIVDDLAPVKIEEVILATATTVEGDATALYIRNALAELSVQVTRIAQGMPKGGELEYADDVTLSHAIEGRRKL